MATNSNKFLITTETHEVVRVRRTGVAPVRGFCSLCKEQVDLLPFDTAVILGGLTGRQLIKSIGSAAVHAVEPEGGPLLVCAKSLNGADRDERSVATQQLTPA